ncbi:MAG: molybdate ABC transporter substrate-binding protein [Chthoniobacterales bacterium]
MTQALSTVRAGEVQVFAASSLTDALKEIAENYARSGGERVGFNFAASSLLARQIEERAPADIFFSADEEKMNALQKAGLIVPETRRDLLSNSLVLVTLHDSKVQISAVEQLESLGRIAVANPRSVPAGIYAREYLTAAGIWGKLEPKLVPTENVRAALAAVESGNVDAGFVYKTDANISKKVKVVFSVPAGAGPRIEYPVALVKESANRSAAEKFLRYVESEAALQVFEKFGFVVKR